MPSVIGASHVSFSVSDLSGALEWFEKVFGAQVMTREPGEDRSAAVLTLPQSTLMIGLVSFREGPKERLTPSGPDSITSRSRSRRRRTSTSGSATSTTTASRLSGPIAVPPGAILNFRGPDGIALSMFWRR